METFGYWDYFKSAMLSRNTTKFKLTNKLAIQSGFTELHRVLHFRHFVPEMRKLGHDCLRHSPAGKDLNSEAEECPLLEAAT
jgi:hypothetical protein